MQIKGTFKRLIYNRDNYYVGLIRVKDNDLDSGLNDKTITFTGYFSDINIDDILVLKGEFTKHNKYGEQFLTTSYEVSLPDEKDGIVTFLSSDAFKGIGEAKAKKIYEELGDNAIDIIIHEPEKLNKIKGLTKKNVELLHEKLVDYEDSIDTIIKLNDYGFSNKESSYLYNKYKGKTIDILDNNVYDFIDEDIFYKKVDALALKHGYTRMDKRRLKASIIYVFNEVINSLGDTYLIYNEIYGYLNRAILSNAPFETFEECINELVNEELIVLENDKYYLKKMYEAEKNITKRLVYLNNQKEEKIKKLTITVDAIEKDNLITFNSKQQEAIINAFKYHFEIITGGPGTGKTTIIKSIVNMYQDLYKKSSREMLDEITLLAPTGRAAKRIMETVNFPASTIHRFLKWNKDTNKFKVNEHNKVDTKLVIIDEASMIDTYLFDSLLKGLYYDTKIILVGDANQLPSVGSGQILKDLIDSEKFNVVELKELYRQKENSNIITFAYDINNGDYDNSIFNVEDDLTYIECDSYNLVDKFSELCYTYKDFNANDLIILAPMYKTVNGIDNLNLVAREIFNPNDDIKREIQIGDTKYREYDKVIELVNMPDDGIFNGDIGIIVEIDNQNHEVYIDFDGNIVKFTKSNFSNFRLGYVTSIHKSQGSEFKVVIVIMLNEYNRMLYRKLLYTGVTRAKKNLYILGEEKAIERAIANNILNDRKTSLLEMINKMYEKKSIEHKD